MFIERVIQFALLAVVVWQVVIPVVRDRPVFPLFRKKSMGEKQLRRALERKGEADDLAEAAHVEAKAKQVEKQVNKSRSED